MPVGTQRFMTEWISRTKLLIKEQKKMLALIFALVFGLSSGFFIANLLNESDIERMNKLGINSLIMMFMAFFGSQQTVAPFYFEKEPFENVYVWIFLSTFFFALIVTFLVQSKKKNETV